MSGCQGSADLLWFLGESSLFIWCEIIAHSCAASPAEINRSGINKLEAFTKAASSVNLLHELLNTTIKSSHKETNKPNQVCNEINITICSFSLNTTHFYVTQHQKTMASCNVIINYTLKTCCCFVDKMNCFYTLEKKRLYIWVWIFQFQGVALESMITVQSTSSFLHAFLAL